VPCFTSTLIEIKLLVSLIHFVVVTHKLRVGLSVACLDQCGHWTCLESQVNVPSIIWISTFTCPSVL